MASGPVSQECLGKSFDKLEKRSRIRTARAIQINTQGLRLENSPTDKGQQKTLHNREKEEEESVQELSLELVGQTSGDGNGDNAKSQGSKIQHGSRGKQQREGRKLREKRRSTGVVHLENSVNTGGSTTGEEDGKEGMAGETKKKTEQNEIMAASTVTKTDPTQDTTSIPERNHEISYRGDGSQSLNGLTGANRQGLKCKKANDDKKGFVTADDLESKNFPEESSETDPKLTDDKTYINRDDSFIIQLREKDRRIQFLELKIQQLTEDFADIAEEHQVLKEENAALLRAITKLN